MTVDFATTTRVVVPSICFPGPMHSHTHILYRGLLPSYIVSELSLVKCHFASSYMVSLLPKFSLSLSSTGWPTCWQRCCCPIWSGRSSSPQQAFIFKKGFVAKKASFPPKPPPLVARSLHRNINLSSVFSGSTQIAPLLLHAGHCFPLPCLSSSILLKVCDVPGKLLEERPCPAKQHHPMVATSCILS